MTKKAGLHATQQHEKQLLDSVFSALSDPIRRAILEHLSAGPLLVSELAEPFDISLQAISRHIQVLEEAGLVLKERTGRISRCLLAAGPIHDVVTWLNRYSDHWQAQAQQLSGALGDAVGTPSLGQKAGNKSATAPIARRADKRGSASAGRPPRAGAKSR